MTRTRNSTSWSRPSRPASPRSSAPLKELAEFLRVEDDLIAAAAEGSAGDPPGEAPPEELGRWLKKLPAADKDAYLLRFLREEGDLRLRSELMTKFTEATRPKGTRAQGPRRRTIRQLLAAANARSAERKREEAE